MPLRCLISLAELLELDEELDELELELDFDELVGDSFNGFLTVYEM